MGVRNCPKCNGKVSTSRNVCIHCGYIFPFSKTCPDCGEAVNADALECPVCGFIFNKASSVNSFDEPIIVPADNKAETVNTDKPEVRNTEPAVGIKSASIPVIADTVVQPAEQAVEHAPEIKSEPEKKADSIPVVIPVVAVDVESNVEQETAGIGKAYAQFEQAPAQIEETPTPTREDIQPIQTVDLSAVSENAVYEQATMAVACPYCGSTELMEIGIDFFMCETCKNRFLNTSSAAVPVHAKTEAPISAPIIAQKKDEASEPVVAAAAAVTAGIEEKAVPTEVEDDNAGAEVVDVDEYLGALNDSATDSETSPGTEYVSEETSDDQDSYTSSAEERVSTSEPSYYDAAQADLDKQKRAKPGERFSIAAVVLGLVVIFGILFTHLWLPDIISSTRFDFENYGGNAVILLKYKGDNATSVTIPKEYRGKAVRAIGSYAFYHCNGRTSITIPSSVTSIGDSAFFGCTELKNMTIPSYVLTIGEYAFSGCTGLTSITIPSSVTRIGGYAFSGCTGLTSINIPSSVTSIGGSAFSGCSKLTSINIPSSVTNIGVRTFYGCSKLTSIDIPSSVTRIGDYAFSGCSKLTTITYQGTKAQWSKIDKGNSWDYNTGNYTIHCTDGDIAK